MEGNKLQLHGSQPSGRERSKNDFYPTPPECTHALMRFLDLAPCKIWEPACGEMDMVDVISLYGHDVVGTDLIYGDNFFTTHNESDAIITNPPFSLSEEFIKVALNKAPIVAMLLKSQYWHSKNRLKLFQDYPPDYVLPLTWRPDFLFKHKVRSGKPTMEVAWSVWSNRSGHCKYIPLPKPSVQIKNLFN